jgi:tetratricopeptide (TPR) repeat protein
MNADRAQSGAFQSPARFPRWSRLLAIAIFLCGALTGIQSSALANGAQQPAGPRRAEAKTQQERDDFTAAYALTGAAAEEAAANDFAFRYPASELRHYLYTSAMLQYQHENNSGKMLAMGEKVLELDPDNPLALVLTATALADGLADRDRDRDKKVSAIKRNAGRAIQAAEAAYADTSVETVPLYKTTLQSMAYSALGIMKLKMGDDAGAEKDLMKAAELAKIHPDPRVWYHLALAQDHRRKYAAALSSVQQALQLSSSDPELQQLAEVEYERLAGMAKGSRNVEPQ